MSTEESQKGGGCTEDTSSATLSLRQSQLQNANRSFPQSKCNPSRLGGLVAPFYSSYKQFPTSFLNCPSRNKAFVLSNDCSRFKFSIMQDIPNQQSYLDQYNNCMSTGASNCQQYLDALESAKISAVITDALNKCSSGGNSCSVLDVNNMPYQYSLQSALNPANFGLNNHLSLYCGISSSLLMCVLCFIMILLLVL